MKIKNGSLLNNISRVIKYAVREIFHIPFSSRYYNFEQFNMNIEKVRNLIFFAFYLFPISTNDHNARGNNSAQESATITNN